MPTAPGRASKALVATITALVTIAGGTAALADQLTAHGDTLTSSPNVSVTACAVAHAFSGTANVSFQGSTHFAGGATVTVTAAPSSDAATAGITATGGTLTLPASWTNVSPDASTTISLSVPAGIVSGTYKIGTTASGNRAGGEHPVPVRLVQRDRELPGEHAPDRERSRHRERASDVRGRCDHHLHGERERCLRTGA